MRRQTVGLETLAQIHADLACQHVRRRLLELEDEVARVGGGFANEIRKTVQRLTAVLECRGPASVPER